MDFEKLTKNLTDEQKSKAMKLKTSEELLAFVKEEGIELTDEMLDAVSGGSYWTGCDDHCSTYMC